MIAATICLASLAACGGTPRGSAEPLVAKPHTQPQPDVHHLKDKDLNPEPPKKLLSIDWKKVALTSDADAVALWKTIAPTGADYDMKLDEIPGDGPVSTQLAVALLHGGNFTCPATAASCGAPTDIPDPAPGATLDDPCLRRLLALWAIGQLEDDDIQWVRDSLKAIVAIPPPESQLVATALKAVPESMQDFRLELFGIAYGAGHHELIDGMISTLDEPHIVDAAEKLHIAGAFDLLTPESHRATYIAAINDSKLDPIARQKAMGELLAGEGAKLARDAHTALVTATKSPDCHVAAFAMRQLVQVGEKGRGPGRPASTSIPNMMRAMCVLAAYEQLQSSDEPSYLPGYIPAKGLDLVMVSYDAYSETDDDGDGDVHTQHTATVVPRSEVVLPEVEDMSRAFAHCTGTVCRSDEHEFRFTFKGDQLRRLEVVELPPCVTR